ncbi:uncharacterized protein KY384_004347 [Bacidia gigantensis]|uniref:uncharacterized protein n=1 Tax=Bacidia gigantensis TaxID=2732470 RepID=UPI001D04AC40|nr:uncharacterized protein KY384_004347 [Bacidia gigantensis]KAG8530990.1 hypothetical protein KY384_004347 [Bacidia gigantensis]
MYNSISSSFQSPSDPDIRGMLPSLFTSGLGVAAIGGNKMTSPDMLRTQNPQEPEGRAAQYFKQQLALVASMILQVVMIFGDIVAVDFTRGVMHNSNRSNLWILAFVAIVAGLIYVTLVEKADPCFQFGPNRLVSLATAVADAIQFFDNRRKHDRRYDDREIIIGTYTDEPSRDEERSE